MLCLGNRTFQSRLILGTAQYPSVEILRKAILQSQTEIVTISLRRQAGHTAEPFWEMIRSLPVTVLPNTAGCRTAQEAVVTAQLARELFGTSWIKLETVGDDYTLQPDPFALVEAARILNQEGFEVFPYMTEDLVVAERLLAAGCKILMPWGAPIGSARGLVHIQALQTLRTRFPEAVIIIDAGMGAPSHAALALELGFDAVLLNSAVALAQDPIQMAQAFAWAVQSGRAGFQAGLLPPRNFATPSTPTLGTPFWHTENPLRA